MSKNTPGGSKVTFKKPPEPPVKLSYLMFLVAYGFVTVLTPNLNSLDSNGPKFLTLALLNLLTFIFLFSRKDIKIRPQWYYAFFRNDIGIAYTGLMIVSLLSFFKALNVLESVLHFTKIFTTFAAAYLVSILIIDNKRNILYLSVAMTLLLVFDCISVLSDINEYINGKLPNISSILSVYSNKNILASSVFVKIPFALWLMVFSRKWLRLLGILGTFLAILSTLFLSARAFYLGLIGFSILLILFFIIRYILTHEKDHLQLTGIYLIILISAFLIFSTTQRYLYPKTQEAKTRSVGARLASISDPSGGNRLAGWKRSWHVFKEDPILGVGLGNWKIATLKEENLTSLDFMYNYKAHNDFIETATETGIFGGLLFISLFLLAGWIFIRAVIKKIAVEWLALIFLPVFGLFCYSCDAFFNFPQDRPEIQALFALYLGMIVAVTSINTSENTNQSFFNNMGHVSVLHRFMPFLNIQYISNRWGKSGNRFFNLLFINAFVLVITVSIYFLYLNFNSLKLQRIIKEDLMSLKFSHPAALFLKGFPSIPDINVEGEPIAVQKARYLLNEKRNDEAISLLLKDKSSPFDARKEYFIAMGYYNKNNSDSGIAYSQRMYNIKPLFFENISILCNELQKKGMYKQGEVMIDNYLSKIKYNKTAWLTASVFNEKSGNLQKATSLIDTASKYFPADVQIFNQKAAIDRKTIIVQYKELYDAASSAYNAKKYNEAVQYYSELLSKVPEFTEARSCRAFCLYSLKEYTKSNLDLDFLISKGSTLSNLYNLRGINFYGIGNIDEACKNFKIAADMADKDGINNYNKLCKPIKK